MMSYQKVCLRFLLSYSIHSVSLNQSELSVGLPGSSFPAVAMEQCGSGRDPSEAELVHTLSGCPGRSQTHHVMSLVSNFSV